jgi:cytochrome c-type biogenesis protein CcmE
MKTKLIIGGGIVLAAIMFLAFAGAKDSWVHYLAVDAFTAQPEYQELRVRLHGNVAASDLTSDPSLMKAVFDLEGETSTVRVAYTGIVPDMFQAGAEVVVEGRLDEHGIFQADTLLTKCASKYESEGDQPAMPPAHPTPTGDA